MLVYEVTKDGGLKVSDHPADRLVEIFHAVYSGKMTNRRHVTA